ncbi:MAG TPA: zf-TFIIB domain-containing protein [Myxococcales bacterium]|nr:zf-TFIIB domain-containing protein [Myxococcales bacterium]
MPARSAAKAATKKGGTGGAKKGAAKVGAPQAPDPKLEERMKEAEARAGQLEAQQRDLTGKMRGLERELQEARGALKARTDQLAEKARSLDQSKRELEALREKARAGEAEAAAARRLSEIGTGKIRCPRCSGPMTEYQHDVVRADRCDDCHGIFFDNGELEQVVEKTLKDHDARKQGGWFSSLFGKK